MCETVDELWIKPLKSPLYVRKRSSGASSIYTGLWMELLLEISDYEITRESVGLLDQRVALL